MRYPAIRPLGRDRMPFDQRRREFITLLGGATAWPLAARAQHPSMPVNGFMNSAAAQGFASRGAMYRQGLGETGFIEAKNVAIEYRWADGQYDRLQSMAADLVSQGVAVITAGGPPAARAAKAATSVIPIVFTTGDDPVQAGLVSNLNRPGGNVTGVNLFLSNLSAKKLGLLHDLLPQATAIAGLFNSRKSERRSSGEGLAGSWQCKRPADSDRPCQQRSRDRVSLCHAQQTANRRGHGRSRSILYQSPRKDHCSGGALCHSCIL